jgi:GTPase SAR1 family protein
LHVKFLGNISVRIQIWDVAGTAVYSRGLPNALHDADVILLVYDVTQPSSFNGVSKWLNRAMIHTAQDLDQDQVGKTGNPSDLVYLKHDKNTRVPLLALVANKGTNTFAFCIPGAKFNSNFLILRQV